MLAQVHAACVDLQKVSGNTKSARDDQCEWVKSRITFSESVDVLRGLLDVLRSGQVVGVDVLLLVSHVRGRRFCVCVKLRVSYGAKGGDV